MKIFICSRYTATNELAFARNTRVAKDLFGLALHWGYAPFAPHLIYPTFLDDSLPAQRQAGMDAGREWLHVADIVWMHVSHGISNGMSQENRDIMNLRKRVAIVESFSIPWEESKEDAYRYMIHGRVLRMGVMNNGEFCEGYKLC